MNDTTNILIKLGFQSATEVRLLVIEINNRLQSKNWEEKFREKNNLNSTQPIIIPRSSPDGHTELGSTRKHSQPIFYGERDDL